MKERIHKAVLKAMRYTFPAAKFPRSRITFSKQMQLHIAIWIRNNSKSRVKVQGNLYPGFVPKKYNREIEKYGYSFWEVIGDEFPKIRTENYGVHEILSNKYAIYKFMKRNRRLR
jgi:hypothetical protein